MVDKTAALCVYIIYIYRPFLLLLIFCLRQYHSVCILSSNVMSMAVEDLNLATLFTSFSLSGSEAKFREGQGSRSSKSRSSSGGSCVVILMAVGSARRHTFGVFLLTAHNRLSHTGKKRM